MTEQIPYGKAVKPFVKKAAFQSALHPNILTQIILEEARNKNFLLPAPLLHLMIQHGESVLAEFFEKHLQQTIKSYLAYKHIVDEQFRKWLDLGQDLSDMAQKTMAGVTPFQSFHELFSDSKEEEKEERKG
jgi:polyhydroxyalkanoate synthesis regulator protein